MRPLFEPFQEFERVARNRPHPGIDRAYPKVTDGTMASVIQKTPRRIIQQIPSGNVYSDAEDWLTRVSGFILTNKIIPNAKSQYTFIQKTWNALSKALTYGSQPAYIPFVNRGKYFGPDMVLPYIKDVFLEPGKLSDEDSNFILMRAWYQPRDIKALIARQMKLKKSAEDRGDKFESGWDLKVLEDIANKISQKDDLSTTANERDKNNRNGGIEIFHAFQRGIGGQFYSFHQGSKQVVRTVTNPDPRGVIPIHYLYADTDGSNPLGRGFVELAGAMQNLMDSEVQMYQYNRALMLNPPIIKRGEWNKNQAKMAPNTLWDLGSSPNNTAEALKIDSSAIQSFPSNYGLMKSQLVSLLSSPSADISAESGNPSFSKTSAGVKSQQSITNVDDNYLRKQTEAWLGKVYETQLNLYFAEKSGVEELQLDKDTAATLRDIDPNLVNDKEKIRIDYDTATPELNFMVDAGSSEIKDDQDEIAQLKEILADVNQNPYSIQQIQQAGKELQLGEVYKQLFSKLGLKDIDKILTDMPKGPDGNPQPTNPQQDSGEKPKFVINYDSISSPTVKAAILNEAGIQADPNDIAQSDMNKAQMDNPQKEASPQDHPIIKLMTSLNIKFTDLPEDSKQEVLQIIGIPTQELSPTQQNLNMSAIGQQHAIVSADSADQQAQAQMDQSNAQQQAQTATTKPGSKPSSRPTPPKQPSDNITPEDRQFIGQLQQMGLSDQQIGQALAMLHHGMPVGQIMKAIQGAQNG